MTRAFIAALLTIAVSLPLGAEQFGMFGKTRTKTFTSGDVSMEYPDGGGWRLTPGAQDVLMLLNKQPDVRVALIRMRLANPVATDDEELFGLFARLEGEQVKADNPGAEDVQHAVVIHPALGRVVRIEFTRPSVVASKPGVRERAQQISVPSASAVYRLVYSGSPREFEKEVGRFNAMLDSLRIGKPASQDRAS